MKITTARASQRKLYYRGYSIEQTGKHARMWMRIFYKRHSGWPR